MIEKIVDEYLHFLTEHMDAAEYLTARELKMLQRVQTLGINFGHGDSQSHIASCSSADARDEERVQPKSSNQSNAKNTNMKGAMKEELAKSNKS